MPGSKRKFSRSYRPISNSVGCADAVAVLFLKRSLDGPEVSQYRRPRALLGGGDGDGDAATGSVWRRGMLFVVNSASSSSLSVFCRMSDEKPESEALGVGGVLMNGVTGGGRESPAVGVSGCKPLVNGDLGEGDGEDEYGSGVKSVVDGSTSSTEGDLMKVRSSVV